MNQARHIDLPDDRRGGIRTAFCATCAVSLAIFLATWARSPLAWGQPDAAEAAKGAKTRTKTAAPADAANPASQLSGESLLRQAHAQLLSRRSIRVDVTEIANLTEPPLRLTGRYVSAGVKLRLEYRVELNGGVAGSLLEVCDGERLWSLMQLPGSQRVTRRDVRQILAAAERAQARPERAVAVDLALGGLPALLTSLQRSMDFDAVKEDKLDEQAIYVLTGRWKKELAKQFGGDGMNPSFPPHIPDAARLTLAAGTLFPVRLTYLKRQNEGVQSLLDLRFRNVVLDELVDDREFNFTPPDASEPEDITRQYLQQLFPEEAATSDGAPAGNGGKKP